LQVELCVRFALHCVAALLWRTAFVSREHWVINNRDYSRRVRNYNEENQTCPFVFDFSSVITTKYCIHSWFY